MKNKVFLILSLIPVLAACGQTKVFSYNNPDEPKENYLPVPDQGIVLDGKDTEDFYTNCESISYNINESGTETLTMKVHFAEKGLLIYCYTKKNAIYENPTLKMYRQDSVEFYINPSHYKDGLTSSCIQVRVSPSGREEVWVGVEEPIDGYEWTFHWLPFVHAQYIDGVLIDSDIKNIDQNKNSKGVGYEIYMPYSSMNLNFNPKGMDILPACVNAYNFRDGSFNWISYRETSIYDTNHFPSFGHRITEQTTNKVFNTAYTLSGFHLDHSEEKNPWVTQVGFKDQYASFNVFNDRFLAYTHVKPLNTLKNDENPKVGMFMENEFGRIAFLLDPKPDKSNYQCLVVNQYKNHDWDWLNAPIGWAGSKSYDDGVDLEIIRDYNNIYYKLNSVLLFSLSSDVLSTNACRVGFMTMNHSALYTEFGYSLDSEVIDAEILNLR